MKQDSTRAKTVLLIDDDDALRETMRRMLAGAQYAVIEAASGKAGLKLFDEHRPPLVITDILMPDKDGIETVREIRRLDSKVRIIAISGGGAMSGTYFLKVAQEFGATETIEKPFRRDTLLEVVERLLKDDRTG